MLILRMAPRDNDLFSMFYIGRGERAENRLLLIDPTPTNIRNAKVTADALRAFKGPSPKSIDVS